MNQDLNTISVYDYIVASNPMKAANFLASKGIKSNGGSAAMQAYQNAPALLGKSVLETLANPNISEQTKAGALFILKDGSANLQKYVSSGGEPALKEVMIALHPDKEALVSALSKSKHKHSHADGDDKLNCCGKMNADGSFFNCGGCSSCGGSSNVDGKAAPKPETRNTEPETTTVQTLGPTTTPVNYTNILVAGLLILGLVAIIKSNN